MQASGSRASDPALSAGNAAEGRLFAFTLAGGFLFFALLGLWRGSDRVMVAAASLAAVSLLAGLVAPSQLEPVRRAWMKLGEAIGHITTPVLMAIVYYIVVTPLGLARRVTSARSKREDSDWHRRPPSASPTRMERQF